MKTKLTTLEQRLSLLIDMPTLSYDRAACRTAIQSISEELDALGMYVEAALDDHPCFVATTHATRHPRLMLVAHLDIVPPTESADCRLVIDSETLKGRGVFDMKFAAACYLELVHELAEQSSLEAYDFGIMLTTDEEIGGAEGAGRLLSEGWSTDLALIPDGGDNWAVEAAAKGISTLRLTAHGRSAHSSRPWEGDNAIHQLVGLLDDIRITYPYRNKDGLTLSINQLTGGQAVNQIADTAEAIIDMRAFHLSELEEAEQYIRRAAHTLSVEVETILTGNPVLLDKEDETVQAALDTLEQFRRSPVSFTNSYGTTDGRWFSLYDVPTLIMRPNGGNIHGPGEWLAREDLGMFYDFIRKLTNDIARKPVDEFTLAAQTV